LYIGDMNR